MLKFRFVSVCLLTLLVFGGGVSAFGGEIYYQEEIFYQEIFPSSGSVGGNPGVAGWTAYSGAVAGSTTMSISGTNGMPQDALPINSDPQVAGTAQGWSYFTGGGAGGSFTWTDEFTDSSLLGLIDITEVGTVSWYQGHKNATMETRAALKVGEQWYLSSNGFTNVPMASGVRMGTDDAELKEVDLATEQWYPLAFNAGLEMSLDMTGASTSLPSGNLTGAGLYFADTGGAADTCRFDTFAIADVPVPIVPGDEILYQEIFPSDGLIGGDPGVAGWTAYSGAVAGSTTMSISGTNGMPQDALPINSDPQVAGIEQGWSYFTGGGAGGSFTWTDEFTDSSLLGLTDITEVGTVSWYQGHKNATMETRAALKVGEQWYLSSNGFTNVPMASGNSMYADAELKEVDLATELWYPLVFDAGLEMSLDMTGAPTSLPSGNLTGAGLYFADTGGAADTCRFDTFAIAIADVPSVPGDANGDGKVDGSDVTILAGNWQVGVDGAVEATWAMGDFNSDGKVDGSDVTILAGNWQAGVTATAASVPEPSTIVLILVGMLSALSIRRKR